MEREELLWLFNSLDFVTINPVVIIGYTIIILVPAKILGLKNKGTLAKGMDADIVVFDEDVMISDVFVMGNKVR